MIWADTDIRLIVETTAPSVRNFYISPKQDIFIHPQMGTSAAIHISNHHIKVNVFIPEVMTSSIFLFDLTAM